MRMTTLFRFRGRSTSVSAERSMRNSLRFEFIQMRCQIVAAGSELEDQPL